MKHKSQENAVFIAIHPPTYRSGGFLAHGVLKLCQVLIKSLQYKNRFLLSLGKHEHKALRCIYPKCFLRKHERTSFASNKTPSAAYSFSASLIAASMCVVSNMFSYVSMLMTTKSP